MGDLGSPVWVEKQAIKEQELLEIIERAKERRIEYMKITGQWDEK